MQWQAHQVREGRRDDHALFCEAMVARAYDEVFTLSYITGRSVGIGAYLNRLGQRTIQMVGTLAASVATGAARAKPLSSISSP